MSSSEGATTKLAQADEAWVFLLNTRIPPEGHTIEPTQAEKLDDEVRSLDRLVALAKRRRNAHISRLCRLPAEIITMILMEIKRCWRPEMIQLTEHEQEMLQDLARSGSADEAESFLRLRRREHNCATDSRLGWISATHVCSLLREVSRIFHSILYKHAYP